MKKADSNDTTTPAQQITNHIAKYEAMYDTEVLAALPLNNEMARLGSGGLFCNRFPDHPFSQALKGVAERILR